MNKYKYIILTWLAAFTFQSCGDDFLTLTPTGSISEDDYYYTETDIYSAVIAAYDPLQWDDFYGGYNQMQFMSDIRADDVFVAGDGAPSFHHEMAAYNMDPVKAPERMWNMLYTGVNRCNMVFEKMERVIDISDENKNRYLAEVYFLRAWYYHWLWKFWGNVPYYTVNLRTPKVQVAQITANELYAHIMDDLDFALTEGYLPRSVGQPELGRVTCWAAMMLQARVVMYQNDETRYDEVYNNMRNIKLSSIFRLTTDYAALWLDENEHNSESIWEVNYRSEGGSYSYSEGGEGTAYPTWIGVPGLTGDPEYNSGWGYGTIRPAVYELYNDLDIRRDGGILNMDSRIREITSISYEPRYQDTGLFNRKYAPRQGYNDCPYDVELNYMNNLRVFRYSEALLNHAELAVKLGKSDGQNSLDQVRLRALGGSIANLNANPLSATPENILNERRLEFVGEGMRFWDLVRTDNTRVLTETNQYWSRTWADYLKYLPIPASEIDLTWGEYKLKQNPGYPGGSTL